MKAEKQSVVSSLVLSDIGYKLGLWGVSALVGLFWILAFIVLWPGGQIDKLLRRHEAAVATRQDPTGMISAAQAIIAIANKGDNENLD